MAGAAFEAGIKLASVYHQFIGAPISSANVEILEKAIEKCVRIQPFVQDVKVRIEQKGLKKKEHEYDYISLTGNMLNMRLKIKYNKSTAIAEIRFIEHLNYPLMYITSLR